MFGLLQKNLGKKLEPTWEPLYDPEWSLVRTLLMEKVRRGHIRLQIIKHGPDQYSAYYERMVDADQPLSMAPEWYEHAPATEARDGEDA